MGQRTIICILTCLTIISCQQNPNTKNSTGQKKRIKSKTTVEYYTDKINNDSENITMKTVEQFDTIGRCSGRTVFNELENLLVEHFYVEWKNDTMVEYSMNFHSEVYPPSLLLSAKRSYINNRIISEYSITYQVDGRDSVSPISSEKYYYYNAKGKLIRIENSDNGNKSTTKYIYNGDTLKKMTTGSNIRQVYSEEYFYDKKGRKIKQSEGCYLDATFSKIRQDYSRNYSYNEHDSLITWSHYRDNKLFLKYEYQYNSEGNIIIEKVFDDFKNGDTTKLSVINEYYYNSSKQIAQITTYFNNTGHPVSMEYY